MLVLFQNMLLKDPKEIRELYDSLYILSELFAAQHTYPSSSRRDLDYHSAGAPNSRESRRSGICSSICAL
jgi:hypothetical protein